MSPFDYAITKTMPPLKMERNKRQQRIGWNGSLRKMVKNVHRKIVFSHEAIFRTWLGKPKNDYYWKVSPFSTSYCLVRFSGWQWYWTVTYSRIRYLETNPNNPDLHRKLVCSEEVHFHLYGYVNKPNWRTWGSKKGWNVFGQSIALPSYEIM